MEGIKSSNKTIAINTFYLYLRMFVQLAISLYTSRIILRELGIVDYGINNVVSSLLSMLTFIQGSLSSSASRFLAFEIGKGERGDINLVFCTTLNIHIIFSVILVVLSETIGLWYFYNKLVIPEDRYFAALVVYQISVLSSVLSLIVVPYNAMIIAQERMKAFAYLNIINVLFKLLVAYVLCITPIDKLITNSVLGFLLSLLVNVMYYLYCKRNFNTCNFHKVWDKEQFSEMMTYSGWSILSYSPIVVSQLTNLLINAFFGPVVNAARAVSTTVQQSVNSFVLNFQVALNPQIIKNYAANDDKRVSQLVVMSQKITLLLILVLFLPLLTNIEYVLRLWLTEVPEYSEMMVFFVAINGVFLSIINPLGVLASAANKIKIYNLVTTPYYLLSVVAAYIALRCGADLTITFVIFMLFDILSYVVIVLTLKRAALISAKQQLYVYFKVLASLTLAILGGYIIRLLPLGGFVGFISKASLAEIVAILTILTIIVTKDEIKALKNIVKSKINK